MNQKQLRKHTIECFMHVANSMYIFNMYVWGCENVIECLFYHIVCKGVPAPAFIKEPTP